MLPGLARFCYRRRWTVLIAWVVLLVGVNVLAQTVGGDLLKTFSLPGTESQAGFDVLRQDFARTGDTGDLVWKAKAGAQAPAVQAKIDGTIAQLKKAAGNKI